MREIKFRAWDGQSMHENVQIIYGKAYKEGYQWFLHGAIAGTPMQYTGLKDCNGKEIYEGDIATSGGKVIYRIDWVQNNAQYFLKVIKTDSILTRDLRFPMWQYTIDDVCAVEVIGNIYENKELLEVVSND